MLKKIIQIGEIQNTKVKTNKNNNIVCFGSDVPNKNYKFELISKPKNNYYDAIIILVNHKFFKSIVNWRTFNNTIKINILRIYFCCKFI